MLDVVILLQVRSKKLLAASIILIIQGTCIMLFLVLLLLMLNAFAEPFVFIFILLAWAVISLIAGIMGAINWKKPEKAFVCFVWGIGVIVISIAGGYAATALGFPGNLSISMLIIYVAYTVSAYKLHKTR